MPLPPQGTTLIDEQPVSSDFVGDAFGYGYHFMAFIPTKKFKFFKF